MSWEIWAYSHAALVRHWDKEGSWGLREGAPLSLASGFYGAWFHVGETPLDAEGTARLVSELQEATSDARAMTEVGGANFVVHEGFCQARNVSEDPFVYTGENADEAVGLLIRAGLPILGASRIAERDYIANTAPLILHNPVALPLDLRDDLQNAQVALVLGREGAEDFDALNWDVSKALDPLGDARVLRKVKMPEEAAEVARHLSGRLPGPLLVNAPESCLHFHYWLRGDGVWMFLLGNIEVGAEDAVAEIRLPKDWPEGASGQRLALAEVAANPQIWEGQAGEEYTRFFVPIEKKTSLVVRLHIGNR